jgi:hypothetical protein
LLKYFYILATSFKTHCRIIAFKKKCNKNLKCFVDVDGPFLCLQNGGNSPQKKISYITNIYSKFSKKLDKVYNDFKY